MLTLHGCPHVKDMLQAGLHQHANDCIKNPRGLHLVAGPAPQRTQRAGAQLGLGRQLLLHHVLRPRVRSLRGAACHQTPHPSKSSLPP